MLFLTWGTDYTNLQVWCIESFIKKKHNKNQTSALKLQNHHVKPPSTQQPKNLSWGCGTISTTPVTAWQVSVQLVVWEGSREAAWSPVPDTATQQDVSTSGSIYYWSPASGREKEEGMGTGMPPVLFAGPRHEGGMAFHLLHSHQLQLRAALEQLYLLAYPNSAIAVVDIRDSFRHFILLSVLYCFHEHITWTSQSQHAFKNQSYSEREKPQTKTSKPRRILIC